MKAKILISLGFLTLVIIAILSSENQANNAFRRRLMDIQDANELVLNDNHKCIHDQIMETYEPVFIEEGLRNQKERSLQGSGYNGNIKAEIKDQYQPIRIHMDFSNIDRKLFSIEMVDYLEKKQLPLAKIMFQKLLKVIPVDKENPILIPKNTIICMDSTVVQEHKDNPISDSDLLIYVKDISVQNKAYRAYGGVCVYGPSKYHRGRPLVGGIQYNFEKFPMKDSDFEGNFDILMHEITHILGFSKYSFPFFVDSEGIRKQETETVVNGIIVAPTVRELAKKHFNCESLKGIPAENNGESGSAGSHWDRIYLQNEVMTASLTRNAVYTNFTLALLKDSGWYQPNYDEAQVIVWGKNAGCDFVNNTCNATSVESKKYLCKSGTGCTYDKIAKGKCISDFFTDDCKYVIEYSDGLCNLRSNANQYTEIRGEFYGKGSMCFDSTINVKGWISNDIQRCHKFDCLDSGLRIYFSEADFVECNKDDIGKSKTHIKYRGAVECPDPAPYCQDVYNYCIENNFCSGNGICSRNICLCAEGYKGSDCGEKK